MKKLNVLISLIFVSLTGCVFIDTGNNEDSIEIAAMAAISQTVYSTTIKDPEKYIPIYEATIVALKSIDSTVDMTPEELSAFIINEISKKVTGDYSLIVNGVIDALLTKYNIGWSDKIPHEKLHKYIQDTIKAIEIGLDKAKSK